MDVPLSSYATSLQNHVDSLGTYYVLTNVHPKAEIPTDPFDGKPLRMKVVPGGLDLYSVGPGPKERFIHFYLGQEAYKENRIKPAREERKRKKKK